MTAGRDTRAQPGNQLAVKHGAHAVIAPEQLRDVADAIRPALPVQHQADELALFELADVAIRLQRIRQYLDEHDPWSAPTPRGRGRLAMVQSALRHEEILSNRKMRILKELGMTAAARARLGLDIMRTVSLTEAMNEKDPVKRQQLLAQAGVDMEGEDNDG
jgi:hypothetical protein